MGDYWRGISWATSRDFSNLHFPGVRKPSARHMARSSTVNSPACWSHGDSDNWDPRFSEWPLPLLPTPGGGAGTSSTHTLSPRASPPGGGSEEGGVPPSTEAPPLACLLPYQLHLHLEQMGYCTSPSHPHFSQSSGPGHNHVIKRGEMQNNPPSGT